MSIRMAMVYTGMLLCMLSLGFGMFMIIKRQQHMEDMWLAMHDEYTQLALDQAIDARSSAVVERVVSTMQLWRPVQEQAKDTVVQVFSQVAEIDLLQPYKTPGQGTATGSGFFINEQGDLITNAHVVDQATTIWIQIPSLGKRVIDVEVIGVSPDRDLALLRVKKEGLELIRHELGGVPFLALGDSDIIRRSNEVMALGYPLGQQSLKSTTGVVSGRERNWIQISAAINPGNSGGPLINNEGQVIGINNANVPAAQNVGYAIPVNDLKIVLPDLYKTKILRKPFLGIVFNNATESLTEYLNNPLPGGAYVVEVVKGSTLDKAGIKRGDMIYEIDNHKLDIYGEMSVPWSEDKISLIDYVSRLSIGQKLNFVVYRSGKRKEFTATFSQTELPSVHEVFPGYEKIDYEVFAGMVVQQLSLNLLQRLGSNAPGLAKYMEMKNRTEPVLIITHIFPSSHLYRSRGIMPGSTIHEVNGRKVSTLDEYRKALKESAKNKFMIMRFSDNVARRSDNVIVALPWYKLIKQEPELAQTYKYPLTTTGQEIVQAAHANNALKKAVTTT